MALAIYDTLPAYTDPDIDVYFNGPWVAPYERDFTVPEGLTGFEEALFDMPIPEVEKSTIVISSVTATLVKSEYEADITAGEKFYIDVQVKVHEDPLDDSSPEILAPIPATFNSDFYIDPIQGESAAATPEVSLIARVRQDKYTVRYIFIANSDGNVSLTVKSKNDDTLESDPVAVVINDVDTSIGNLPVISTVVLAPVTGTPGTTVTATFTFTNAVTSLNQFQVLLRSGLLVESGIPTVNGTTVTQAYVIKPVSVATQEKVVVITPNDEGGTTYKSAVLNITLN